MAGQLYSVQMQSFGGVNYADDPAAILSRSHVLNGNTFRHAAGPSGLIPVESAAGKNFDFLRTNLIKRKGSTSYADISATLITGDAVVIGPLEFRLPNAGSLARFVLSKKTIYTDQSGTWAQINDSTGSAYTHSDATVTSGSIVAADGGIMFGMDGTNKIQRYRSGANLDQEMDNGNTYYDAGGTSQTVTGTWGTGYDRLAVFEGRLVFNDGTSTVQYTAVNKPYDLNGGGNFPCAGAVRSLSVHVPKYASSLSALVYCGTSVGFEFTSDLASANILEGSPIPLNKNSVFSSRNWLLVLDASGWIWGINGNVVIDLGRRLLAMDGSSGPLDNINLANSTSVAHGSYNPLKRQAAWFISTAASGNPDTAIVLDFWLGEPAIDESLPSYERHVRCLQWTGQSYISAASLQAGYVGMKSDGTMWTLDNGKDDFGTTAVDCHWYSPLLDGGDPAIDKGWKINRSRFASNGNWNVQLDYVLNRDASSSKSVQINQGASGFILGSSKLGTGVLHGSSQVSGADDTDLWAQALQLELTNGTLSEDFRLYAISQDFRTGIYQR